jgi:hypothetical protein
VKRAMTGIVVAEQAASELTSGEVAERIADELRRRGYRAHVWSKKGVRVYVAAGDGAELGYLESTSSASATTSARASSSSRRARVRRGCATSTSTRRASGRTRSSPSRGARRCARSRLDLRGNALSAVAAEALLATKLRTLDVLRFSSGVGARTARAQVGRLCSSGRDRSTVPRMRTRLRRIRPRSTPARVPASRPQRRSSAT